MCEYRGRTTRLGRHTPSGMWRSTRRSWGISPGPPSLHSTSRCSRST
jgi:hypothetical protein